MVAAAKPNEIQLTRVYDAPVKAVWEAWTDPTQLAKWWGPRGFSVMTHSHDLRVGGHWAYTMRGPDQDYENKTVYHEVEVYRKLVYDHGGHEDRPPLFRVTVTFSEVEGKTLMEMVMTLATPEAATETRKRIKMHNGNSTWDRLAEHLTKERMGKEQFVINRTFDAPLELMFDAWTDPKRFSQWLPPTGFTMQFLSVDVRAGGMSFYLMSNAEGLTMYGKVAYLEIVRPERLVYLQQFADEHGNVSRHPMAPTWPETMLTTVTFAAEGAERTRVRVEWEPFGATTAEEMATFVQGRGGMTQGWTGSFDKLEGYLSTQ